MKCEICSGEEFSTKNVLWKELIDEWQLSPDEVRYIDHQQGTTCRGCGVNIRSNALARSIKAHLGLTGNFSGLGCAPGIADISILEINEAGHLTPYLSKCANHVLACYPEVDMHQLPYADQSFDLVTHSDTLEHVASPVHALRECHRVLRATGALCFTVPTIVGRMSRGRDGLKKSFHGPPGNTADDYLVHTEFGADMWTYLCRAGFSQISIHTFDYPAGVAFTARK